MSDKVTVNSNGISLFGAMFLVMFVLKLLKIITISWWWVTAPLWIPIALVMLFVIGMLLWAFAETVMLKK